jgi:hypothetical protein
MNMFDRNNSFKEYQKNKINEVLNIDPRMKLTDQDIANYHDYFFDVLEQRESNGQLPLKKESYKTTRDFTFANMMKNGMSSIDEKLKVSRFNF